MPSPLSRNTRSNGAACPFLGLCASILAAFMIDAATAFAQTSTDPDALQSPKVEFIAEYQLPTGLRIGGVEFGGLSALDFDPETGLFVALSDDRAERGPARFYRLNLDIDAGALAKPARIVGVDIAEMVEMTGVAGDAFLPKTLDPEGLRRRPDGGFYWADERDADGVPFVGEMDDAGQTIRAYELPEYYKPGLGQGVRVNLAFESLAVDGDGRVVAATEQALLQDGPETDVDTGSLSRVLVFDQESGAPLAEYVYPVEPVAALPSPSTGFKTNGLVELLALPGGGFLALERSFSVGQGNVVQLFVTDFAGADDVLGIAAIDGLKIAPMRKKLILTLQSGGIVDAVDNLEAMSFGPELGGRRTLVLMSDNNFNPNGQFTQILLFYID